MAPKRKTPCNTQDLPKPWSIWFHRSFYGCTTAYGSSQARGSTCSYSYSLQQSPTNTRSKPYCCWWHHGTLIPLSQVRDWNHILLDTLSGLSQTEPQWEIRGYIFGIEHLYDKTKENLQQCGHVSYTWMGRLNTEYGQIPTEVFFFYFFFFGPHGWNYSKMDKEKIKEPEHQT